MLGLAVVSADSPCALSVRTSTFAAPPSRLFPVSLCCRPSASDCLLQSLLCLSSGWSAQKGGQVVPPCENGYCAAPTPSKTGRLLSMRTGLPAYLTYPTKASLP